MNRWTSRLRERVLLADSPILIAGTDRWGVKRLVASLRENDQPLVLIDLSTVDTGDSVALGDALSEAVRIGLSAPLFGTGTEAEYGLSVLGAYLPAIEPITVVIVEAERSVWLAEALAELAKPPNRLVLTSGSPASLSDIASLSQLGTTDLAITEIEALDLFGEEREESDIRSAVLEASGAIAQVEVILGLDSSSRHLGTPTTGTWPTNSPAVDLAVGIDALVSLGKWVEALEMAALHAATRVPELIDKAGSALFDTGQFDRLWRTLTVLPSWLLRDERVLYWKFSAAVAVNKWRPLLPMVDRYLENHIAPDVRALRATIDVRDESLYEARRAYQARQNATTASALGFLLAANGDTEGALQALTEAIGYGEHAGNPRLVVSIAGDIGLAHMSAGQYSRAEYWAGWALKQFHSSGLREELLRLSAVNMAAYTRILTGAIAGAEQVLSTAQIPTGLVGTPTTEGVISTLGDISYVRGEVHKAKHYYELVADNAARSQLPTSANDLVRVYTILGMRREALAVAHEAVNVARELAPVHVRVANLALGCALAAAGDGSAESVLREAADELALHPFGAYPAQAAIQLGVLLIRASRPDDARAVLENHRKYLEELGDSGWLLLGGAAPEVAQLKAMFRGDEPDVKIRLLGRRAIATADGETPLSLRFAEVIAVLAASSDGLRGEQLALALYGEQANPSTMKAIISRTRKVMEIESQPYRLAGSYEADFVTVHGLLRQGKVQAALELYRGPLLPESEAPAVVELREHLEESLRQAVLASGDPDAMIDLANQQGDDLELWEETRRHLPPNDPRRPLANARIRRIRQRWRREALDEL